VSDAQLGHEKTLTALTAALAGVDCIYGAGMTESGMTFDPVQLAMDDEWIAMIRHFQRGVPVDRASLAIADIASVGPFGDFLSLPGTLAGARRQSMPALMDRRVHEEWYADGATDMYARAAGRVREILCEHRREPLADGVREELEAIVARADRERGQ